MAIGAASLDWPDYLSLVGYFVAVVGFGIWSSCRKRDSGGGLNRDFLAGRSMHWIPVGASLFASNIGSGHFIGIAGSGASVGIGSAGFELNALWTLVFLGWVFLPVYIRAGVFTMPEYLKKRFGGDRIRVYLSVLSLILYIFTKISADLLSGALFLQRAIKDLGDSIYLPIIILLIIAAVFTIGGGLTAVIWTDFIQTIIMLAGAFYLMIRSFIEVGGYNEMKNKFGYAIDSKVLYSNRTDGIPPKDYLNLARGPATEDYPWPGMLFGALISSIWYWCTDQVIVQRVLAAKNLDHARAGCVVAGLLKFLPLFLILYPGMIARILYKNEVGCSEKSSCKDVCGAEKGCSNIAYPALVMDLMPEGARGLMIAVVLAALMSSLTSIFNSSSTLFTIDIYKRIRVNAKEWELMIASRVFVIVLVGVSIVWVPIIQNNTNSRLFDYIQSVTSFLSPPICAVFLNAVFFKRVNETAAFWSLMIGLVVGMIRFILEFAFDEVKPAIIKDMHFLHFGMLLFGITNICIWTITLLTKPIPEKYITALTYESAHNDSGDAIQIPSGKGFGKSGFCAAANLDDDVSEKIVKYELNGHDNKAFDKKNDVDVIEKFNTDEEAQKKVHMPKLHPLRRIFYFICGIESMMNQPENEQVESKIDTSLDSIKVHPFWSKIINIMAALVFAISGFFIAFFNKY